MGILGGMGPAATADFYTKLIEATPASSDQEHLRVLIWADPTVPDRSAALVGEGPDPTPALLRGAEQLKSAGADFFVTACNSAHAFLPRVWSEVDLPYLSIVEVTAKYVAAMKDATSVGVLGTDATLTAALYQRAVETLGLKVVVPSKQMQRTVMEAIYAVKAGTLGPPHRNALVSVARQLEEQGAGAIIAGCTEIPLALETSRLAVPLVDPARVLAAAVVEKASQY